MAMRGLLVAAPSSGSGKTTVTLGLLRALKQRGVDVTAAKSGPDYIDPAFHRAACGKVSVNLDAWAMPAERLRCLANRQDGDLLIVEGAMGLFDSASDGTGSAADLAETLGIPVILVIDAARHGQTAAVIAQGLARHREDVHIAGVILNNVGSVRHSNLLCDAFERVGIAVFGELPAQRALELPSRHLGLVQAMEIDKLDDVIDRIAVLIKECAELEAIDRAAQTIKPSGSEPRHCPSLGRNIAIAHDAAFAFSYPHMLEDWRLQGVDINFFSPLADEPPDEKCDAIFLPGGYPELHAEILANARNFRDGMYQSRIHGAHIYGECGGFMVLGESLIDRLGQAHPMLGMLPLETSFATRRRYLGYRHIRRQCGEIWRGHEFHYATITRQGDTKALFDVRASNVQQFTPSGMLSGNVSGSFIHLINPQ